ncbi:MAG: L,D-transpeptidase family protein [Planktotalea sp.]|uniref:L,D-transpeptidase family protein n=1 Tax=Planktotalea sp. TaxID=2029877 RepID=UPI003C7867DA
MQTLRSQVLFSFRTLVAAFAFIAISLGFSATPAGAQVTAFKQAVAEAAAKDKDIAAFYQANNYKAIWTGSGGKDRQRRDALLNAVTNAADHGLPVSRYNPEQLTALLKQARSPRDRGAVEVEMSRIFLQYARDLQTGVLTPSKVDADIVRQIPHRDRVSYLTNFTKSSPKRFFQALAPTAPEYARLMKAKLLMEQQLAKGGWGQTVPAKSLKPGQSGNAVVILRNRLQTMGYLQRSSSQTYDAAMQSAMQQFQLSRGLNPDGVAGPGTMNEINRPIESHLQAVMVAMERERWMNRPRGKRHVWVNLTDFSAVIVDNGKETFRTRSVIGKNQSDRRSPEFSDVMEFMVINPTWNVPRSIATKEYLPLLQRNPNAVGHLNIVDSRGRTVSRSGANFGAYNARNFPYSIKQPPSSRNALGLVKFMFPNRYNIYLHDTPAKNLFSREMRAYSHGCIRLHQPFDFAYALLAKQTNDPEGFFKAKLNTGVESRVNLEQPVPVHIVYRTAFVSAGGNVNFRPDVYGRDAKIFSALSNAGVRMRAVGG